jgi:hypothetical protein
MLDWRQLDAAVWRLRGNIFAFSNREADPAFAGRFQQGTIAVALADRCWTEVRKFATPELWIATELGTMCDKLPLPLPTPVSSQPPSSSSKALTAR